MDDWCFLFVVDEFFHQIAYRFAVLGSILRCHGQIISCRFVSVCFYLPHSILGGVCWCAIL